MSKLYLCLTKLFVEWMFFCHGQVREVLHRSSRENTTGLCDHRGHANLIFPVIFKPEEMWTTEAESSNPGWMCCWQLCFDKISPVWLKWLKLLPLSCSFDRDLFSLSHCEQLLFHRRSNGNVFSFCLIEGLILHAPQAYSCICRFLQVACIRFASHLPSRLWTSWPASTSLTEIYQSYISCVPNPEKRSSVHVYIYLLIQT